MHLFSNYMLYSDLFICLIFGGFHRFTFENKKFKPNCLILRECSLNIRFCHQ